MPRKRKPGAFRNGITPRTAWERLQPKLRVDPATGCHVFTGAVSTSGYGQIREAGRGAKQNRVHRVAYEALVGQVPPGLQLDHLCRNRLCCNPAHLEPVTARVNTLRGTAPTAVNAAKTHCAWGHEFTPGNTRQRKGGRECLACKHERSLARSRGSRRDSETANA